MALPIIPMLRSRGGRRQPERPKMVKYGTVGSNDLERACAFYEALLATIGMTSFYRTKKGGRFWGQHNAGMFAVLPPYDGGPATVGNGGMVGFCLDTRA